MSPKDAAHKDAAPIVEGQVAPLSDPWLFIADLDAVLKTESLPAAIIQTVLAALLALPEIDGAWFLRADQDGRLSEAASGREYPLECAELARSAWRAGTPHTSSWAAAIPLRSGAGCHGLVVVRAGHPHVFARSWRTASLSLLASVIGGALETVERRAALDHTRRLYQTLFACVDKLLTARAQDRALRLLCAALVDSGLFVAAGVGIVGANGVHRHIAAAAKRNAQALRTASLVYVKGQPNRPLTFDAWESGQTVVANRYFSNPRFAPAYWLAEKLGFQSIAALVIPRGGKPWATLSVCAATENYFDDVLIQLLERMTEMVGRVLDELDLKATLRAEREAQRRIAREDVLTSLPNRRAFHEELAARMARSARAGASLTVAMLDLNGFKQINDRWGHAAGDHILRAVGSRIRTVLRESDFSGRLGGDEFALILDGFLALPDSADQELEAFCGRLQRAVSAPVTLSSGQVAHVWLCAGFAALSPEDSSADILLRRADRALYDAKAENGERGRFWRVFRDQNLAPGRPIDSWRLLQNGALETHFQPVLDLEDGRVSMMEALARLRDGAETILPAKFLPQMSLEERSLLFCKVLEASIETIARLTRDGCQVSVSVNLDGQVLLLERTLPAITKTLAAHDVPAARLILEILETHEFFNLEEARSQIRAVRAAGIRIALDDVGAGHSSLLKIRDLPLDIVKLDRDFVSRLAEQPDGLIFIATLQTMTAMLGMRLIVEGAEDGLVVEALRFVGVRHVQGYGVARPMDGQAVAEWLRAHRPHSLSSAPRSLLGAYAVHARWVRALEVCPVPAATLAPLLRADIACLGEFFAGAGAGLAPVRLAYEKLAAATRMAMIDRPAIMAASLAFRQQMIGALRPGAGEPFKTRRALVSAHPPS